MSETKNYHLYLTDDSDTSFLFWRNAMNGLTGSNMEKIDNALSEKADSSRAVLLTLKADDWVIKGDVSAQEIVVDGLTIDQNGVIGAAQNLTDEQMDSVRAAGLYISEQKDGSLTIASDGTSPACDIPVVLILLG